MSTHNPPVALSDRYGKYQRKNYVLQHATGILLVFHVESHLKFLKRLSQLCVYPGDCLQAQEVLESVSGMLPDLVSIHGTLRNTSKDCLG